MKGDSQMTANHDQTDNRSRRDRRRRRRGSAGFTLLEIMVVLAIIGLIAGSVGVMVFSRYKSALIKTAKTRVTEIANATVQYMLDHNNTCPGGTDALVQEKYLKKGLKDPWGKEFVFKCPGSSDSDGADVSSAGPDKQDGTADDIKSWDQ